MPQPILKNGDRAFGIEGTFRIEDIIYVLNEEANHTLMLTLADNHGYHVRAVQGPNGEDAPFYTARLQHRITQDERFDDIFKEMKETPLALTVSTQYIDHPKFTLAEPDIHGMILSAAWQPAKLSYYDRPRDHFDRSIISRMSGFVKNMVDVPFEKWQEFVKNCGHYHSQDFIRALALWAAQNSDNAPREVRLDRFDTERLDPALPFVLKFPHNNGIIWHFEP
ncbi:MAG TPA: hypothetical protein PLO23_06245 [Alphaproteobacteria bacterium]|nr:hypothetical protein [Alphaproteobacteria bacterium]